MQTYRLQTKRRRRERAEDRVIALTVITVPNFIPFRWYSSSESSYYSSLPHRYKVDTQLVAKCTVVNLTNDCQQHTTFLILIDNIKCSQKWLLDLGRQPVGPISTDCFIYIFPNMYKKVYFIYLQYTFDPYFKWPKSQVSNSDNSWDILFIMKQTDKRTNGYGWNFQFRLWEPQNLFRHWELINRKFWCIKTFLIRITKVKRIFQKTLPACNSNTLTHGEILMKLDPLLKQLYPSKLSKDFI